MKWENSSAAGFGAVLILATTGAVQAQTTPAVPEPGGNFNNFATTDSLHLPAVSEINGKVDYSGGNMNSAEGHNFSGSITLPISHQFGFQADALYSRISNLNFYGGAGHLFWRNPDYGLLGLTGGYLYRDGADTVDTFQAGAEGELYWRQFNFGFFGGLGSIDYQYSAPFIDTNPTRFIGRVSADYYPLENLRVGASFTSAFKDYFGKAEAEYQLPINGLALTGEVALGNHGYDHWLLGVRYYFGGKKTLRDRQRQDDPRGLMPQILQSLGVYGAEFNRKENAYIAAHPSSSGSSGGGDYGVITIEINNPGSGFGSGIMSLLPPTSLSPPPGYQPPALAP
ncbi:MAG TPA: hypothetical protein VIK53_14605 [Verrucomicrobiae bacterium]